MNARIKELVNLASEYADHYDKIGVDHSYQNIFNEKFAELIVRECAEQVKNLHVNDYGISGAEIIREHFGV